MKKLPWVRLYTSTLSDPKVQRLSHKNFRGWINCLLIARMEGGHLAPDIKDNQYHLKLSKKDTISLINLLITKELLVEKEGFFHIKNWNEKQFESDSSTARVNKHRKKKRECNVSETDEVTPPDTDTDTDTDKPLKKSKKESLDFSSWPEQPDPELIKVWFPIRKFKKHQNTQYAMNAQGKIFWEFHNQGFSVNKTLAMLCGNSWSNLKIDMIEELGGNNGKDRGSSGQKLTPGQRVDKRNKELEQIELEQGRPAKALVIDGEAVRP